MSTILAPLATARPSAAAVPTPREFLTAYGRVLLVPLAGVLVLAPGWALVGIPGWPVPSAAAAAWSLAVAAWLGRLGWPAATALLTAWLAPTALLAPLAALGWLSPSGLVLWGPLTTLLATALVAGHDLGLVHRPTPARRVSASTAPRQRVPATFPASHRPFPPGEQS